MFDENSMIFIKIDRKSIIVSTKKNTYGKQKRGGDFAEPQKSIAIKK